MMFDGGRLFTQGWRVYWPFLGRLFTLILEMGVCFRKTFIPSVVKLKTKMMRTPPIFTEAAFLKWQDELAMMQEDLRNSIVPLTKENILTAREVCELLGVTDRTLRTYRKKGFINFVKFAGCIFYLKHLLYLDLLRMYYQNWGRK